MKWILNCIYHYSEVYISRSDCSFSNVQILIDLCICNQNDILLCYRYSYGLCLHVRHQLWQVYHRKFFISLPFVHTHIHTNSPPPMRQMQCGRWHTHTHTHQLANNNNSISKKESVLIHLRKVFQAIRREATCQSKAKTW